MLPTNAECVRSFKTRTKCIGYCDEHHASETNRRASALLQCYATDIYVRLFDIAVGLLELTQVFLLQIDLLHQTRAHSLIYLLTN